MVEQLRVDVVGVGSNATDLVINVAQYPERGSKTEYASDSTQLGGSVATAVAACQLWGDSTRYVGKLGDDHAGNLHMQEFARIGVEAQVVREAGAPSARSVILVDATGERTVLGRRDERILLRTAELRREWVTQARVLHVDSHDAEAALCAAQWAREAGVETVADLDLPHPGTAELLPLIDYPVFNREFAPRWTGVTDLREALRLLHERFRPRLCAATLGEEGVLAYDGERWVYRPAFQVDAVDTTGAGDLFHAGFIHGLLQGWELERQLDFACAAAALNCTVLGARGRIGTVEEIEALRLGGARRS